MVNLVGLQARLQTQLQEVTLPSFSTSTTRPVRDVGAHPRTPLPRSQLSWWVARNSTGNPPVRQRFGKAQLHRSYVGLTDAIIVGLHPHGVAHHT